MIQVVACGVAVFVLRGARDEADRPLSFAMFVTGFWILAAVIVHG